MLRAFAIVLLVVAGCWRDVGPPPVAPEPPPPAVARPPAPPPPPPVHEPARLRVTGVDPARGDADGGTYVRILGERFVADGARAAKIYFGSRQGTVIRFESDTEMIVEAPGGKVGDTVDVLVVFEPGGELRLPSTFTYVERKP
jgi:hypothetical protein